MAPTDGAIVTKMNMCTPQTTDVNISKGQSSRAIGLGGVAFQRSKSPTILYKYRLNKVPNFPLCVHCSEHTALLCTLHREPF